jgi:ferredoxin-fold anticodon binding domain-containing protein
VSEPELKACWKSADATIQRDVLKFWREENLIPEIADAAQRLKNICVVAYDGARIVAALEAKVRRLEMVRSNIAMLGLAVAQERRNHKLASDIVLFGRDVLEKWSSENLDEKLMGIGRIVPTRTEDERLRNPIWEPSKLTLIGFTPKGAQVRVAWFKHATVT